MDLGLVLAVSQKLYKGLHSSEVKKICSLFGYKAQLDDLQHCVSTIRAVLCDAENEQKLSFEARVWVEELKNAVYDADDLLDEFVTLAEQKQLTKGKFSERVQYFFSSRNPLFIAYNMTRGAKKIRNKLGAIANNHCQFGFRIDSPSIKRREETCSYLYEGNIIGREDDVENILSLLLDSNCQQNSQQNVSFLTIVGIGGLGKTSLAQLVYNDARITSAFPLRCWTCVSDHEQEQWNVKEILHKILASATGGQIHEGYSLDWLQSQVREKLARSKYLLVLDDVWTENRHQWLQLENFLLGGQRRSWIVVTTRSKKTARIVGGGPMYELQGLSTENSWLLFENNAFVLGQSKPHDDLVKIGKEIVKGCARNPLAIRVAGSLLNGQEKSSWLSLQERGLCNFKERENDIMPILMYSYHQLEFPLKSCFALCALFPKDYEVKKDLLIDLWIAQGYIIPLDEGQSIEDAAEEYFSILLQRCFFQNVEHDEYGEIFSFKLHDLLHDVAKKVAGQEICITNSVTNAIDEKVRHVAIMRSKSAQYSFTKSHIRSFLYHGFWFIGGKMEWSSLKALLANWNCLRVMDLSCVGLKGLPDSIGKLLHLRYLDISHNDNLKVLPKSVVKLYNLQTLNLCWCQGLKELPKDLRKLVKLRVLNTTSTGISCMPKGLGQLSCLQTLTMFPVKSASLSWNQLFDQLEELEHLKNLKGRLHISIDFPENARKVKEDGRKKRAYLRTKNHLNDINIILKGRGNDEEAMNLMDDLQPPSNVKSLLLIGCDGVRMPCWGRENNLVTSLPHLIRLELSQVGVYHLTCLGNLLHLKKLSLDRLQTLDCIIEERISSAEIRDPTSSELFAKGLSLFPSLEELNLSELPKLERWSWKSEMGGNDQLLVDTSSSNMTPLLLPQLKKVSIQSCLNLKTILLCPILEEICLEQFNRKLQIIIASKESKDETMKSTSSSCRTNITTFTASSSSCDIPNLWRVETDSMARLSALPLMAFQSLKYLSIRCDKKIVYLEEGGKVLQSCSPTLRYLNIEKCCNLKSILCKGFKSLSSLKDLCIIECHMLQLSIEESEDDGVLLASHTLQTLLLEDLPLLTELPSWLQYFYNLQSLTIRACKRLDSLPDWFPNLTSLTKMTVLDCSESFTQRCRTAREDQSFIPHLTSLKL